MKIGVTLPNNWGIEDPHEVLALGPLAESLGFDSVWVMDHLLNVARVRDRLGDRPYWHPLAMLAYLCATTERVMLGTSVLVLPYHDPVGLAKQAATIDGMSRGRVILGVGVGALTEEFEALGVPMRRRGALTDESIAVMKDLWTSPVPSYRGGRYRFENLAFSPRCVQQPHVPLWIGGSSPAAIARTARSGQGWHPTRIPSAEYALGCAKVRALAAESGRDADTLEMSVRLPVDLERDPDAPQLDRLVDEIQSFRRAGATHVVLALDSGDAPRVRRWFESVARAVIPALR